MVRVLIGDIFGSTAQTLVNTVNCVGVMGKGIALGFRERFPDMFEDYVQRCMLGEVKLGRPYLYRRLVPPWILNFPTKGHWRSVSKLSDIVAGLEYIEHHYRAWGIASLAVPPLGCGHGQLEWRVVGPTVYRHLERLEIPIEAYAPHGAPTDELQQAFLAVPPDRENEPRAPRYRPQLKTGEVALVEILNRIHQEPYHWPVGRTMFHKIAYFATACGVDTGLSFHRGSFGPFSSEIKPLIARLANNGLIEEQRLDRMLVLRPGSTYPDAARTYGRHFHCWDQILERVVDLFLRMRTSDADIAATVHFVAHALQGSQDHKPSETDVLSAVRQWKQERRPPLNDEDIARAIRSLNILRWVALGPSTDLPLSKEALVDV